MGLQKAMLAIICLGLMHLTGRKLGYDLYGLLVRGEHSPFLLLLQKLSFNYKVSARYVISIQIHWRIYQRKFGYRLRNYYIGMSFDLR